MQDAGRQSYDRRASARPVPGRISTLVLLLALVLIAFAAASLVFIGRIASNEADAQARKNEIRLFDNALRDRETLMAREQLALARWTKSYRNIVEKFNPGYLRSEFIDFLWADYGHDRSYLIRGGNHLLMAAREGKADFAGKILRDDDPLAMLAQRSIHRFMRNREPSAGGFRQKQVTAGMVREITEFAFAVVDDEPAIISAMAIVPDEDSRIAMPDGPPVILISAKFLRHAFGRELNAQLAFRDFSFEAALPGQTAPQPVLVAINGAPLGGFRWASEQPGTTIWSVIIPVIAMLAAALALAATLIAHAIGRISTRLEASEASNRQLALHDALTGLANRLHFNRSLDDAAARLPENPFALIACDLDRFKAVNDTFGHAGGDAVIRAVAHRLTRALGPAGLVGRLGGDEFVILVTGFCDRPRLEILSRQIILGVCDSIDLGDGTMTDVGISLGIAHAPDHGRDAAAIMAAADAALYAAKARGRGIAIFAQDLGHEMRPLPADVQETQAAQAAVHAA